MARMDRAGAARGRGFEEASWSVGYRILTNAITLHVRIIVHVAFRIADLDGLRQKRGAYQISYEYSSVKF